MSHRISALKLALAGIIGVGLSAGLWLTLNPHNTPPLSAQARLGQAIFLDVSLSASGQQSCATCHVEALGHASSRGIEPGGPVMQSSGMRNVPSLRYLARNTSLQFDDTGKASGGFMWDGSASSLEAQAGLPFLNPVEMANTDLASVVNKLAQTSYASEFAKQFGAQVWQQPDLAFAAMGKALASYQLEDPQFQRFDSKFDLVQQGKETFNPAEERGWALFKDEEKGNCAACHTAQSDASGLPPLFTDFSYDNLGVPRNDSLAQSTGAKTHDLGLCAQTEVAKRPAASSLCGAFKVPSLRNVAVRRAYFHNAKFTSLRDVVRFYATRDTQPSDWYGSAANKFNDLPRKHHGNVNTSEVPYGQKIGEPARLSAQEIDDLVAFLHTLTDADLKATTATPQAALGFQAFAAHAGRSGPSPGVEGTRQSKPKTTH